MSDNLDPQKDLPLRPQASPPYGDGKTSGAKPDAAKNTRRKATENGNIKPSLTPEQASIVKGMLKRGDAQHDIAAHFYVNPGRVAEVKMGYKHVDVPVAPLDKLPPPILRIYIDPDATPESQYRLLTLLIRQPPPESRVITIVPALADLILERLNTNNRRERQANIARFAGAIETGRFILTGDTIKFSTRGLLIDGQNRLRACVRAGIPFRTHVVFGIDEAAFDRIDANAVRTNPDTLDIAGAPYAWVAAPAVRWIMLYDHYLPVSGVPQRSRKIDNRELLAYYREHIDAVWLTECCRAAIAVGRALPASALAAHAYMFAAKDPALVVRFLADLLNQRGGGLKLLQKVTRLRQQNLGRLPEQQINALIIQAWNAYRAGVPVTLSLLNWDEQKTYPEIQ